MNRSALWFLIAALVALLTVGPGDRLALATITTTGSVTGTGTPYNGTDNPWVVSDLKVADGAAGSMTVNGGYVVNHTVATNDGLIAVGGATGVVTIDGSGSKWTNMNGGITVGSSGVGTLNITGGGGVTDRNGVVGMAAGSVGNVVVGDGVGSSTWSNTTSFAIGLNGTGTLTINGGGSVSTDAVINYLGFGSTGDGTMNVGGGTGSSSFTSTGGLVVGHNGTGKMIITGGGSVSNTDPGVIGLSSGNGTVTVGGGTGASTWTNSDSLFVGSTGTGVLNINTGGLVSADTLEGGNATSSIQFGGGTLRVTSTDSASNTMNLQSGGGTIDVPTAATTFTVTSAIGGTGGLTKTGAATLELTGANSYSGDTTVSAGTLKLSASGSFASSPTISVAGGMTLDVGGVTGGANHDGLQFSLVSGQTLKGTGSVAGAVGVASGATVSPGNSVGALNTNSISIATGGTLAIDIDLGGSMGADLLNVSGSVSLASSTLSLSLLNPSTMGLPLTFLVVANDAADAVAGTFGAIVGLPVGYMATIDYAFSGTDVLSRVGNGNDIAVTIAPSDSTAVPEAGAAAMLGLVLAAVSSIAAWRKLAKSI